LAQVGGDAGQQLRGERNGFDDVVVGADLQATTTVDLPVFADRIAPAYARRMSEAGV